MAVPTRPADLEFHQGDRLRKAREHAGHDAKSFAELLGISRDALRGYERGKVTPRRPVLNQWALATGVPVEWLSEGRWSSGGPEGPGGGRRNEDDAPSDQGSSSSRCTLLAA